MPDSLDQTTTSFTSTDPQVRFPQRLAGSRKVLFVVLVSLLFLLGVAYTNRRFGNLLTGKLGQIVTSGTIKISLLDAFTGEAISNVAVKIHSDSGVRCFQAPCDTGAQNWSGNADKDGFVFVPSRVINKVTTITATGYKSGRDLNTDSEKLSDDHWVVELDPDSKVDNFERRLKLVNSQTQKPLANTSVWITNSQNCQPPECADYSFKGETNKLGNVYYLVSAVKDSSWIFVKGYKPKQFVAGWANFKVKMEAEAEADKETQSSGPPAADETAGWKTYANRTFNFTFKYPANLGVIDLKVSPSDLDSGGRTVVSVTRPGFTDIAIFGVGVVRTEMGLKQFVEADLASKEVKDGLLPGSLEVTFKDGSRITHIKNENLVYLLSKPRNSNDQLFDQILPTFRFLDPEVSQPPGWKSHLFTQYNLEFKYPSKWNLDCPHFTAPCSLTSPGTEVDNGMFLAGHRGAYMYISAEDKQARRNYSTLKGAVEFYVKQDKYSPSEKKINNIDGYELAEENHALFIFENDDYFFFVSWIPLKADDLVKGDLDSVLSSFRFLE